MGYKNNVQSFTLNGKLNHYFTLNICCWETGGKVLLFYGYFALQVVEPVT